MEQREMGKVGLAAADMMEKLERFGAGGSVGGVVIVAEVDDGEGGQAIVVSSNERLIVQHALMQAGSMMAMRALSGG